MFVMNQESILVRMRDLIDRDDAWGTDVGRRARSQLTKLVSNLPAGSIVRISMSDVRLTDSSFARESVIRYAQDERGTYGFCLTDIMPESDLHFNWQTVAEKAEQPIAVWYGISWHFIGPEPTGAHREVLDKVMAHDRITAGQIAVELGQSVQNISNKLKALWDQGYILRTSVTASSGGHEFEYYRIK